MVEQVRVTERPGRAVCVYCRQPVERAEFECPGCGVGLHAACRVELGRCPTLGCVEAKRPPTGAARAPGGRPAATVLGWGLASVVGVGALLGLGAWHARQEALRRREELLRRRLDDFERQRGAEEAEAEEQERQEDARRRTASDAQAALLDTPVHAALEPLVVPDRRGERETPGTVVADLACESNRLRLEAADLRRAFTAVLLRALALREAPAAGSELRPGDHGLLDVSISRGNASTRFRARLRVARSADDRVDLLVRVGEQGPLDWTERWRHADVEPVLLRQGPRRVDGSSAEGSRQERRDAQDADGTLVHAAWSWPADGARPLLPDLARLVREADGVRHEVELRQLEWDGRR